MRQNFKGAGALFAMLMLNGALGAQGVDLSEAPLVDQFFQVELAMKLEGHVKFYQEGKLQKLPQTAQARHRFVEKILAMKENMPLRSARVYKEAQAVLRVDGSDSKRVFRQTPKLLVAQHVKDQAFLYSPESSLTREEVELTEHFDTLAITGLLPGKSVKAAETWAVPRSVVQALCDLEGVITHDMTGQLLKVEGDIAHFQVTATVSGIDLGAAVKILVQAKGQFDTRQKRIVALSWHQDDQRQQGPASPALSATVDITMKRQPIAEPNELNKFALVAIPTDAEVPEHLTRVAFLEEKHGFQIQHARDWIMVAHTPRHAVWRLLDQGDWVAQATVTPWDQVKAGNMTNFETFVTTMSSTIGWVQEDVIQKNEKIDGMPEENKAYRFSASGSLDGVKAVQYFYLVASPQGEQLVVTFTMTPNQVQKLGTRDLNFIQSIHFHSSQAERLPISLPTSLDGKKD